jgi:DNA-binding response OmpR family regulator
MLTMTFDKPQAGRRVSRAMPLRGLVVEDQALIGLSIEAYLDDLGLEVGGSFLSQAEALRWLDGDTPDFAILDYALRDGPCVALARLLKERGVPFVVYSGHRLREVAPEFHGVIWIDKPAPRSAIIAALSQLRPELAALAAQAMVTATSEPDSATRPRW